ncbi:MAG: hypothetical protein ABJC61_01375 [Acidobacteriota bacterium]
MLPPGLAPRSPRGPFALVLALLSLAQTAAAAGSAGGQIARGSHLANGVARCFWCHSPLDKGDPASPIRSTLGSGDVLDPTRPVTAPI